MRMSFTRSFAVTLYVTLVALWEPAAAFDLQGHRGARGLAPENTLPSFALALSLGVTTLELDLAITKDSQIIVAHDRRLNPDITRLPNGEWISSPGPTFTSLTLEEIKLYDVGQIRPGTNYAKQFPDQRTYQQVRMPTLGEVVALTRKAGNSDIRFAIETKLSPLAPAETLDPETFARAVIGEVLKLGIAGRVSILSFDWRTLAVIARDAPEIPRVYLTIERGPSDNIWKGRSGRSPWTGLDAAAHGNRTPRVVHAAGGKIWSTFFQDLDAGAFSEAKSLGLTVLAWTVNDKSDMAKLIDMGVDGIVTDRPDRLREVLSQQGKTLPIATPVSVD